jgi:hypothetical protein
MRLLARYIYFSPVRANSARMLLHSALPTGPSLNLSERVSISSNNDENYNQWQQMLNVQLIKMRVNRVSMIGGSVSLVITQ